MRSDLCGGRQVLEAVLPGGGMCSSDALKADLHCLGSLLCLTLCFPEVLKEIQSTLEGGRG